MRYVISHLRYPNLRPNKRKIEEQGSAAAQGALRVAIARYTRSPVWVGRLVVSSRIPTTRARRPRRALMIYIYKRKQRLPVGAWFLVALHSSRRLLSLTRPPSCTPSSTSQCHLLTSLPSHGLTENRRTSIHGFYGRRHILLIGQRPLPFTQTHPLPRVRLLQGHV